jgi:hypothetical protein
MKSTQLFIAGAAIASLTACAGMFEDEGARRGATEPPRQAQQDVPNAASDQLVRRVQEQLQARGMDPGPVDGIWGPRTQEAVQQFQREQGLETTGQLNARTLAALDIIDEGNAAAGASPRALRDGPQPPLPSFSQLDANDDGYISVTEAAADPRLMSVFERADKDDDMRLDRDEFRAAIEMVEGAATGATTPRER